MGPALPASHGPRTWDVGQAPCEGRPDTRWSGRAPPREQRGRSPSRPADCVRTEEKTLDTLNPIQGGANRELLFSAPEALAASWAVELTHKAAKSGRTSWNQSKCEHLAKLLWQTGTG